MNAQVFFNQWTHSKKHKFQTKQGRSSYFHDSPFQSESYIHNFGLPTVQTWLLHLVGPWTCDWSTVFFGGRGSHTQVRISTTYHLRIQFLTGVGTPAVKQVINFCIWSITWRWPPQACEGGSQFTGILLAPVLRRARFRGSCHIAFRHPLGC